MSLFSSGKHGKVHGDPFPYRNIYDGSRWIDPGGGYLRDDRLLPFTPRPEFDRPLTNPANRVLSQHRKYRDLVAEAGFEPIQEHLKEIEIMLEDLGWHYYRDVGGSLVPVSGVELLHAQRVLTRLANLTKDES